MSVKANEKKPENLCDEDRIDYSNSSIYFSQKQPCPDVEHGGDLKVVRYLLRTVFF